MAAQNFAPPAHNFQDLTDSTFGKLRVLRREGGRSRKIAFWRCVCECGRECVVAAYYLTTGGKQDCGCMRGSRLKEAYRKFREENPQPTAVALVLSNGMAAVVDHEDYERVRPYFWSAHRSNL
jgi:hypothetical protein